MSTSNSNFYLIPINNIIDEKSLKDDIKEFFEAYDKIIPNNNTFKQLIHDKFNQLLVSDTTLNETFKDLISNNFDQELNMSILNLGKDLLALQKTIIKVTYKNISDGIPNKELQTQLKKLFTALSAKSKLLNNILMEKEKDFNERNKS